MSSANINPFREPYEKPSYLFGGGGGDSESFGAMRIYDGSKSIINNQLIIEKYKGENFVQLPNTNNILYKKKANGEAIFLQICHGPYTATEHAQAQAIRAKNLSHLDFLYRQLHEGNKDAILQQMQQILYTTPTLEDLQRIEEEEAATFNIEEVFSTAKIIGIYQVNIPSAPAAALQTFAFGKNNYTSIYKAAQKTPRSLPRRPRHRPRPRPRALPEQKQKIELQKQQRLPAQSAMYEQEEEEEEEEEKEEKEEEDSVRLMPLSKVTSQAQKDQLVRIAANKKVMEFVGNGHPWTETKVLKLIQQSKQDWADIKAGNQQAWMHWAIIKGDDDGTLIGYLAIYPEKGEEDDDMYFLRYFVQQNLQREGYGSQALRLAIKEFQQLRPEASFLYASVHDRNKGGQDFLEKNLFTKFGETRQIGKITVVDFFKSLS